MEKNAWKLLREEMIENQILSRGIDDKRVIEAIRGVPRHRFVPAQIQIEAYNDSPLPVGYGQTISQPYIVAFMTNLCKLNGNERILEIGTGTGYQTAVLSLLAKTVYTVEKIEPLAKSAKVILDQLGYSNIQYRIGSGFDPWPNESSFDVIILTAAPTELPQSIIDQLIEGGTIVAPVGTGVQNLIRAVKKNGKIYSENICGVRFVPMV